MTEQKFDSKFHKFYVGGEGEVVEKEIIQSSVFEIRSETYEEVLEQYRKYVNDPKAELPEEIMEMLNFKTT